MIRVDRPRVRSSIALGALFLLSVSLALAARPTSAPLGAQPKKPVVRIDALTDTVIVFGPQYFVHDPEEEFGWTSYQDDFDVTDTLGRRYILDIAERTINTMTIKVNGQEWVGQSDYGSTMQRLIDVVPGNMSIFVVMQGDEGAGASVRVVHVSDPSYQVHPWTQFTKLTPADTQVVSFPVDTANAAPVGLLRMINGSPSGSNRVSSCKVWLNGTQVLSSVDFGTGRASATKNVTLLANNTVKILNQSASGTYLKLQFRAEDDTPPVLTLNWPPDTLYTDSSTVTLRGRVVDQTWGKLRVNGTFVKVVPDSFVHSFALTSDATYSLVVKDTNSAGLVTSTSHTVIRDTQPPSLIVARPAADTTVVTDSLLIIGSWSDASPTTVTIDEDTIGTTAIGTIGHKYALDYGPNRMVARGRDYLGRSTEVTRIIFRSTGAEELIDSTVTGPTLSTTGATPFYEQIRFLLEDVAGATDPLQSDWDPDSLDTEAVSVIRGRVLFRDGGPLPNVTVLVLGHPGTGHTLTRKDGRFDLVVNGGAQQTLRFTKTDFLEAQRQLFPTPNAHMVIDDIALIGRTVRVSEVDSSTTQVAVGRFASDANGDRSLRLIFPQGTVASVTDESGTTDFTNYNVRATEYTVGADGPETMPAALPRGSAYTYCVELSLDEADAMAEGGDPAPSAEFNQPVGFYAPNFLGFPVGSRIPFGHYDRVAGRWVADEDGRVIGITGVSGEEALIDVDGDALPDATSILDSLGINSVEREQLAASYLANTTLWRASVQHFTTYDFNPNAKADSAARAAVAAKVVLAGLTECPPEVSGSIIDCDSRVLGQQIPIVGSPFTLNYRSFRMPGDAAMRTLRVRLSDDELPSGLEEMILEVDVAGRKFRSEYASQANKVVTWTWDGKDAFGRTVIGSVNARVGVGYRFPVVYAAGNGTASLGNAGLSSASLGAPGGDREIGRVLWKRMTTSIGAASAGSAGLGGWTLSPHHFYDQTGNGTLYLGDGRVVLGDRDDDLLSRVTATSSSGIDAANGVAAGSAKVAAGDVAVGPDGLVYFVNNLGNGSRIWKIDRNGLLVHVAGADITGSYADSVPASQAKLVSPRGLTIGPDGTVYFAMVNSGSSTNAIRACYIAPDGIVRTLAGAGNQTGAGVDGGDGGSARLATFHTLDGMVLGPDGETYVIDTGNGARIRRVGTDGIIHTYAGTHVSSGQAGDSSGKATQIRLASPRDVIADQDGNLFVAESENSRVRRISADGIVSTVAAGGANFKPTQLAFAPSGGQYVYSNADKILYRLDLDGSLSNIAGGSLPIPSWPGGNVIPRGANIGDINGLAVAPDGGLFLSASNEGIYRIGKRRPGPVVGEIALPARDGSEVYYFDAGSGRHLRTRDGLTGAVLYRFTYDGSGRLHEIFDANGGITEIERETDGRPNAIVAPYGQRTELSADETYGWLELIENPVGEGISLASRPDGLLDSLTDARSNRTSYEFGNDGRLERASDPVSAGGVQDFEEAPDDSGRTVDRSTVEGLNTSYRIAEFGDGGLQRRVTAEDGTITVFTDSTNARSRLSLPSGVVVTDSLISEPRFAMLAPLSRQSIVRLPSGLAQTVGVTRPYTAADFNPPATQGVWKEEVTVNGRPPIVTTLNTGVSPRRITVRSSEGRIVTAAVDSAGRPLSMTIDGLDSLTFLYDSRGRDSVVMQAGRGLRFSYDAAGRLATLRDTLGRTSSFGYDNADRLTTQNMPGGRSVSFGYDAAGNLVSLTPPGKPQHGFGHTAVNLTDQYRPPGGLGDSLTQYRYDGDRRLEAIERPDGSDVSFTYHASTGRLETITIPRGTVDLSYDPQGRLDTVDSPDGVTIEYGYDGSIDISESWSGNVSGTVSVVLDRDFQVLSQQVNGANTVAYVYDNDGLVEQAGTLTISRRSDNGLISGTTLASSYVTTSESQNHAGEPWKSTTKYNGATLWEATYVRDSLGRITGITETIGGTTKVYAYAYSDTGFLTRVTGDGTIIERYGYDANGNRLRFDAPGDSATGTYDSQDRLLRYKNTAYAYTAAGELRRAITGTDTTHYTYDPLGNLIKVEFQNGDSVNYLVDGRNRRVVRMFNGSITHRWLYQNQLEPVAELDGSGNLVSRFVYGSKAYVPDYFVKTGTTYRVISDHLGSVRLVVNAATGDTVQRMEYDGYGRLKYDSHPGFQPFGYAGGVWDETTGLVRFGARDYSAVVGRWTSRDPIFKGSESRYTYASDRPLDMIDPTGLAPEGVASSKGSRLSQAEILRLSSCIGRRVHATMEGLPWLVEIEKLFYYYHMVKAGGPLDIKHRNNSYGSGNRDADETIGNINAGVLGAALGWTYSYVDLLAGIYDIKTNLANRSWEQFGDDPDDRIETRFGYNLEKANTFPCGCGNR